MKCPECGKLIGHEPWCPEKPEPFESPLDRLLKDDDDYELPGSKRFLEPLEFEPEPPEVEPIEPLIPERKPFDDPILERPKDIVFDPIIEKPTIRSPGIIEGIARNPDYSDAGVRFMADGVITDVFGSTIGKHEGDRILDLSGRQIGEISTGGKIISSDPVLHNTFLDKK
jgi:hypothetical protein